MKKKHNNWPRLKSISVYYKRIIIGDEKDKDGAKINTGNYDVKNQSCGKMALFYSSRRTITADSFSSFAMFNAVLPP